MQPTDELYYKYAGVISSVAYHYAQSCPSLADDLLLQAQYIFCKACLSYDEDHDSGASFETWLRNQLQSLSNMIDREIHGPSYLKHGKYKTGKFKDGKEIESNIPTPFAKECDAIFRVKNRVASGSSDKIDYMDSLTGLATDWYVHEYTKKMGASTSDLSYDEYPPELKPYIQGLTGDALTMFHDYCDGCFAAPPWKNITRAKQKNREILNPMKMYRRKYMAMGWSLERVKNAWKGLRGMFRNYLKGKLPSMAIPQEAAYLQAVLF